MGIRFICPECEKRIHVKSFLAGKRGICPKCGGKVQIPYESSGDQPTAESSPPVPPGGYAAGGVPYSQGNLAAGQVATATPVTSPAVGRPIGPQPVSQQPGGQATASPTVGSPAIGPQPVSGSAAQPVAKPADPIAESPQSKWYVRPQSGGQFGPAAGEVMRRWLDEGRVNPDSLVWREGWADWKKASQVFPAMGAVPSTDSGPTPPAPVSDFAVPTTLPGAGKYRGRKRSSNGMAVGMFIGLGVVAVGLLAALMYVLNQQ